MKTILHVMYIILARVLFGLIVEVSLRIAIAVAPPERGCSHFLAVVRANCDADEVIILRVRPVIGLQVDVLPTSSAKPVFVIGFD